MTDTQRQGEAAKEKLAEQFQKETGHDPFVVDIMGEYINTDEYIDWLESLAVREREKMENVKSVAIKNALICLSTEPVWAQKRIKALRDTIKQIGDKELTRRLLETDALGSFGGFLDFLEEEKMELFRKMILARLSPHPPEKEEQG